MKFLKAAYKNTKESEKSKLDLLSLLVNNNMTYNNVTTITVLSDMSLVTAIPTIYVAAAKTQIRLSV